MKTVIFSLRSKQVRTAAILCFIVAISLITGVNKVMAQSSFKLVEGSQITVAGSSNLHDWTMAVKSFSCDATIAVKGDQITTLTALTLSVPVTNLRSKESSMDKRAYSTLQSDKYKNITYKLNDAMVTGKTIKAVGSLTISGVTVPVTVQSTYTVAGGVITFKGAQNIKFSQFNIKSPSFMLGALKVKDDLNIDIVLKLKD